MRELKSESTAVAQAAMKRVAAFSNLGNKEVKVEVERCPGFGMSGCPRQGYPVGADIKGSEGGELG